MYKKSAEKKPRTRKKIENSLSASSETHIESVNRPNLQNIIDFQHQFKCKNKTQKDLITSIKSNDVSVCIGPAGTGKSLVSIYMALNLLKTESDKYNNIKLVKSITQLRGEELPSLPGDAMDKMFFQNMSFFDSLHQLIGERNTEKMIENGLIKFDVIGSFRGRNLNNTIVILDEAQNINHDNLKTILTRLGNNSKLIILGDPDQIDIKKHESSLAFLVNKIREKPIDGINIIEFSEVDIVRHRLTSYFINIFKESKPEKPNVKNRREKTNGSYFKSLISVIKSKLRGI